MHETVYSICFSYYPGVSPQPSIVLPKQHRKRQTKEEGIVFIDDAPKRCKITRPTSFRSEKERIQYLSVLFLPSLTCSIKQSYKSHHQSHFQIHVLYPIQNPNQQRI